MRFNEFYQPVNEGVHDPHIFKAVFMAGSPGSGKSTIAKRLFAGSGLKHLNVDDFYNFMRDTDRTQGEPDVDYKAAWEKYRKREKNYIDGRLGLIIDGTGKNPDVMRTVKRRLEEMGYETAMVFVNTTLDTSLDRVARRAKSPGPDYGREIDPSFVKDTWLRVQKGLGQLQSIFSGNFYIVDNNRGDADIQYVQKTMDKWLNAPPGSHIAKEWIKKELEDKQK